MSKLGQAVLAWDEFLQRDDYPEVMEKLQQYLRTSGHTAFLDQGEAATNEVWQMLAETTVRVGNEQLPIPYEKYPAWLRWGVLDTATRWAVGKGSTCPHAPSITRPQPVASAAWKPGLVVCTACTHLLGLPRGSAKDRTCDGCGHVVGDDAIIWAFTVTHGWLMFQAGACDDCRFWTP